MPRVIYLGFSALLKEHSTPLTLEALEQTTVNDSALLLETLSATQREMMSHWLAHENQPKALVIWPQPSAYIADCLARDESIECAVRQWKAMAEQVLTLFRRHRRQLSLLGMAPGEALTQAGELPGEWLEMTTQAESTVKCLPQAAPLYRLAATQLVTDDAVLQETLAYLNASSHACSGSEDGVTATVQAALESVKAWEETAEEEKNRLSQELGTSSEENALLLARLHNVQEALETAEKKSTELKKIHQQKVEASRQEAEQQLKMLTQECDSTQEENELLLAQLHNVQEELEAAEKKSTDLEKVHREKLKTSPPEAEQQLKTFKQERDSAQEENELLLAQLHLVQEALEEAYLQKPSLEYQESPEQQTALNRLQSLTTWLRAHAYRHAATAYRDSRRYKKSLPQHIALLEQSEYFNADWYLAQYKDVAEAKMNPAEHFIKFGAIEGRNPSPLFNTEFYLFNHPDVAASGQHPLLHYLKDGIKEQRKIQGTPA